MSRRLSEQRQPILDLVALQLENVDHAYEAVERRIRDSRTEVDNVLQLRTMSLEEKVERLRGGSESARRRAQKKLEANIKKVFHGMKADYRKELELYEAPAEEFVRTPMDWKPIEKELKTLASKRLDELQKEDPALADIRKKYTQAGGNAALFKKRMCSWRRTMESSIPSGVSTSEETLLQERVVSAALKQQEAEVELRELTSKHDRSKARSGELGAKAASGDQLSPDESAESRLLTRELERLKTDIANCRALVPVLRRSKENAELLLEKTRQVNKHLADDDRMTPPPKPKPKDLYDIPLRAKHAELTRKD